MEYSQEKVTIYAETVFSPLITAEKLAEMIKCQKIKLYF